LPICPIVDINLLGNFHCLGALAANFTSKHQAGQCPKRMRASLPHDSGAVIFNDTSAYAEVRRHVFARDFSDRRVRFRCGRAENMVGLQSASCILRGCIAFAPPNQRGSRGLEGVGSVKLNAAFVTESRGDRSLSSQFFCHGDHALPFFKTLVSRLVLRGLGQLR
jgi:hypothetical protein